LRRVSAPPHPTLAAERAYLAAARADLLAIEIRFGRLDRERSQDSVDRSLVNRCSHVVLLLGLWAVVR
jgi:hypothetical protein